MILDLKTKSVKQEKQSYASFSTWDQSFIQKKYHQNHLFITQTFRQKSNLASKIKTFKNISRLVKLKQKIKITILPRIGNTKQSCKKVSDFYFDEDIFQPQQGQQSLTFQNHGYYSSYVPVGKNIKLMDQFMIMFPFLVNLTQKVDLKYLRKFNLIIKNEIIQAVAKIQNPQKFSSKAEIMKEQKNTNNLNTNKQMINENEMQNQNQNDQEQELQILQNQSFQDFYNIEKQKLIKALPIAKQTINTYLDQITLISLYEQLLKYGTGIAKQLHKKHCPNTRFQMFFAQVLQASKYFKQSQTYFHKQIPISVQRKDQINQITLAKTMKSMICSTCLIYDCQLHKFPPQLSFKDKYDYYSPKTLIKQQKKIETAINLIRFFYCFCRDQSLNEVDKTINLDSIMQDQYIQNLTSNYNIHEKCSDDCYILLNKQSYYKKVVMSNSKFVSPVIRGIVDISIRMFGFDPCKIQKFIKDPKISCSFIFIYFIENIDLQQRFKYKLYQTQQQQIFNFDQERKQSDICIKSTDKAHDKPQKIQIFNQLFLQQHMCFHYFLDKKPQDIFCQNCICFNRGFCTQQCLCSQSCPLRRKGCDCKSKQDCKKEKCICYYEHLQCQPGICNNCFASPDMSKQKVNLCKNNEIVRNKQKLIRIGRSSILNAGLGCYAGEKIEQNELVKLYFGELVSYQVQNYRQKMNLDGTFYNFGLLQNGQSIDSRYIGNKSRFINHGNDQQCNLGARHVYSKGVLNMGLYALRYIDKDEQLFFNYDGSGLLYEKHRKKYPFIKKSKRR